MNKWLSFILVAVLLLCLTACDDKKATDANKGAPVVTQEEAYNLYYDTIRKFVPELMQSPQECDVDITTRDEVMYLTEHFVRNTTIKVQS